MNRLLLLVPLLLTGCISVPPVEEISQGAMDTATVAYERCMAQPGMADWSPNGDVELINAISDPVARGFILAQREQQTHPCLIAAERAHATYFRALEMTLNVEVGNMDRVVGVSTFGANALVGYLNTKEMHKTFRSLAGSGGDTYNTSIGSGGSVVARSGASAGGGGGGDGAGGGAGESGGAGGSGGGGAGGSSGGGLASANGGTVTMDSTVLNIGSGHQGLASSSPTAPTLGPSAIYGETASGPILQPMGRGDILNNAAPSVTSGGDASPTFGPQTLDDSGDGAGNTQGGIAF